VKSVFGVRNKMAKQNTLLVDIGNSSVKWHLITAAATKKIPVMLQQQYPKDISKSSFIQYWEMLDKPEKVVVSCVANKHTWQALEQACEELWSIKVERITSVKEGFGIVNAYKQASDLGSDRWCAMIGALHVIESGFIVVDCGSAITIDVVSQLGKHLGGYILPGFSMMKQSLGMHTAEVQVDLDFITPILTPSNSTQGCVDSAIYLSVIKLIETVFEQQEKQGKEVQCVLTGGDAALVAKLLSIKYVMMPELVLDGLAIIAGVGLENN